VVLCCDHSGDAFLLAVDRATGQTRWRTPRHLDIQYTTPLLITHSLQDHRCPISEAEILYKTLKALRREVEMVLFPGESHGLSRGGTPSRRLARLHVMREWFQRYLFNGGKKLAKDAAQAEPAMAGIR
jgi:dipeptidyl aminopeptidase/acylaminoacyl peptidase